MNNIPSPDVVFPNEYGTSCFLKNVIAAPSITVGDCTYYDGPADPAAFEGNSGKFCSIASGVRFIMGSASHRLSSISAYPFSVFGGLWTERTPPRLSQLPFKGDTVVGNDVWLGRECAVMPGATIGLGAGPTPRRTPWLPGMWSPMPSWAGIPPGFSKSGFPGS